MPSRGYRKGISDDRLPRPHVIKSRVTSATHAALHAEAGARSMTFTAAQASTVLTAAVKAQAEQQPIPVADPAAPTPSAAPPVTTAKPFTADRKGQFGFDF